MTFKAKGKIYNRRKGKRSNRTRKARVSKTVKVYVKRAIARNLEDKRQEWKGDNIGIYNTIDSLSSQNLMPILSQSTGEGDRVGNRITIKRITLMIAIQMLSTAPSASTPKYVDLFVYKQKKYNIGLPPAADIGKFLQVGNAADQYNGQIFDGLREVNSDLFTIKARKRFLMVNSTTVSNINGQGNMPSAISLKLDITKFIKKLLKYNDTETTPVNDNLLLAIATTNIDATASTPIVENTGQYSYVVSYQYEDA